MVIPSFADNFKKEFDQLLAAPGQLTERVLIPKFVDFIEETGTFILDERLPLKRPDWTYDEPPPAPVSAPRTRTPADADRAPIAVRLAPDVVAELMARAEREGRPVETVVNEALRRWIAEDQRSRR